MEPENMKENTGGPNENGVYKLGVEGRLTRLETTVDEIKNNHLKHIEDKIDKITWLIVTGVIGVAANLLNVLVSHLK